MFRSLVARILFGCILLGSVFAGAEPFESHGVAKGGAGGPAGVAKGGGGRPPATEADVSTPTTDIPVLLPPGLSAHNYPFNMDHYVSQPTALIDGRGVGIQFWENKEVWNKGPSTVYSALAVGVAKTYGEAKATCANLQPKGKWSLPTQSFFTDRLLHFPLFRKIMGTNLTVTPYRMPVVPPTHDDYGPKWWDDGKGPGGPLLFWVYADYTDHAKTVLVVDSKSSRNLEPWEPFVAAQKKSALSTVDEEVERLRIREMEFTRSLIDSYKVDLKGAQKVKQANSGLFGSKAKYREAVAQISRNQSRIAELESKLPGLTNRTPSVMEPLRARAESYVGHYRQRYMSSGAGRYEGGVPVVCLHTQQTPPPLLLNRRDGYDD